MKLLLSIALLASCQAFAIGFCPSQGAVITQFFAGTEHDPSIPDSRCVTYYPKVTSAFEAVISDFTTPSTYTSPQQLITTIQNSTVAID